MGWNVFHRVSPLQGDIQLRREFLLVTGHHGALRKASESYEERCEDEIIFAPA
jgi:hypothetical protein